MVLVTGSIILIDGTPAINPKVFIVDSMGLGFGPHAGPVKMIRYDPATGRFAFLAHVFAAYSGGPEEGPFETGNFAIQIQADGTQALTAVIFDEMPDLKIILPKANVIPDQAVEHK